MRETKLRERETQAFEPYSGEQGDRRGWGSLSSSPSPLQRLPTALPHLVPKARRRISNVNCWLHTITGSCGQEGCLNAGFPWGLEWDPWAASSVILLGNGVPWAQPLCPWPHSVSWHHLAFAWPELQAAPYHSRLCLSLAERVLSSGESFPICLLISFFWLWRKAMLLFSSRLGWQREWGMGRKGSTQRFLTRPGHIHTLLLFFFSCPLKVKFLTIHDSLKKREY